jgi:hypothetical protein
VQTGFHGHDATLCSSALRHPVMHGWMECVIAYILFTYWIHCVFRRGVVLGLR